MAVICTGKGCLPPVKTADEIVDALNRVL
jgi:hypothetical protein